MSITREETANEKVSLKSQTHSKATRTHIFYTQINAADDVPVDDVPDEIFENEEVPDSEFENDDDFDDVADDDDYVERNKPNGDEAPMENIMFLKDGPSDGAMVVKLVLGGSVKTAMAPPAVTTTLVTPKSNPPILKNLRTTGVNPDASPQDSNLRPPLGKPRTIAKRPGDHLNKLFQLYGGFLTFQPITI
ncbi:hypothetical protein LXL04_038427 [Taraxacum kok-saghyz]